MEKALVLTIVSTMKKGTYQKITYTSDITSNKDNKERHVQKVVSSVVRIGIQYSHINVESIQSRKTSDSGTEQLPWGTWDIDCPFLIEHKGNYYLRCTVSRSPKHHPTVTYLVDGEPATKELAMSLTRASEWTPREKEEYVFNPKIQNILSLGKEAK